MYHRFHKLRIEIGVGCLLKAFGTISFANKITYIDHEVNRRLCYALCSERSVIMPTDKSNPPPRAISR